ncbi:MAG: NAD-dependent epimerase/dehydratase family protein [Acidimicrobiia bacterium]|nr:NAD-dependent epimerase/dehydratase family protein [Acidimicrobiia bacterium]
MNVVVVGGAGFIGSHLVDRLIAEGHAVDVVDDLSSGSLSNLADARAAGGSLKIHHLDAQSADLDSLIGLRRPDVIYHLALFPRADRSPGAQGAGFTAALSALEAARAHGVGKIVVALPASSLHGQPAARDLPVKESDPEPRGVRGVVARAVIDLLANYREREMIEFTALALASVYGPRQPADGGVAAALAQAVADGRAPTFQGGGRQTRDFVYVDDVVDALVRAGARGSGLVVNVGTGEQTSIRELWAKIGAGTDLEPALGAARADDLVRFAVSPVRARIHLAWAPWTSLDQGVAHLRA